MEISNKRAERSLGELIDRLAIDQLKQVFDPLGAEAYEREMLVLEQHIQEALSAGPKSASSDIYFLRLVIALAQINLHIWRTKDVMQTAPDKFQPSMKLAHQLNGLRNQLKNRLSVMAAVARAVPVKTNTGTDGLQEWSLSVLDEPGAAGGNANRGGADSARGDSLDTIADSVDALSILQIKEVLLPLEKRAAVAEETNAAIGALQALMEKQNALNTGVLVRMIIFLSQANLHIWYAKDRMPAQPDKYNQLLAFAQDLNSLRNNIRNAIMDILKEGSRCTRHAFFFGQDGQEWHKGLSSRIELIRNTAVVSIGAAEFMEIFGIAPEEFSAPWREMVAKAHLRYQGIPPDYRDQIINGILQRIASGSMWVSGPNKEWIWEKGWRENLQEYKRTRDVSALTPKFIQSQPVLRLQRDYIKPVNADFEFALVDIYRRWLFSRYFADAKAVYEFGCGSCQHLPVLSDIFPGRPIYGLDWAGASMEIAAELGARNGRNIRGIPFNLLSPDHGLALQDDAAVLTVGAMEQLGKDYRPFVDFLLAKRPGIIVHVETIQELYDAKYLLDYLALQYDAKRNYLNGYLTALRELEREGRLEIIKSQRVFFGSMYHDGYSFIVWRPV